MILGDWLTKVLGNEIQETNEYDKLQPNMLLMDKCYIFIILNKYIVSLCITVYQN